MPLRARKRRRGEQLAGNSPRSGFRLFACSLVFLAASLAAGQVISAASGARGHKGGKKGGGKVFMVQSSFTIAQPDAKPRAVVVCPGGKTTVPLGGGMVSNPAPGSDGEGVYPHSYERLGSQRGWHVTPVFYDPSSAAASSSGAKAPSSGPSTPRAVTMQVICGPKTRNVVPARRTVYVNPGQTKTAVATCPGQRRLFGGGFQRTNFVTRGGNFVTASRAASQKSWSVSGSAFGRFGGELTAIAYCRSSRRPIVTEVASEPVPVRTGEWGVAETPTCPGNRVLIFGGFETSPSGSSFFADGFFGSDGPRGTWSASAYNAFGPDATLTAYGYCHGRRFPRAGKGDAPFRSAKAPQPLKKAEKAAISERVLNQGCYPSPGRLAAAIRRRTGRKTAVAPNPGHVRHKNRVTVLSRGASCDLARLALRTGNRVYTINSATGMVSVKH
jgi:hypothetical protein